MNSVIITISVPTLISDIFGKKILRADSSLFAHVRHHRLLWRRRRGRVLRT